MEGGAVKVDAAEALKASHHRSSSMDVEKQYVKFVWRC